MCCGTSWWFVHLRAVTRTQPQLRKGNVRMFKSKIFFTRVLKLHVHSQQCYLGIYLESWSFFYIEVIHKWCHTAGCINWVVFCFFFNLMSNRFGQTSVKNGNRKRLETRPCGAPVLLLNGGKLTPRADSFSALEIYASDRHFLYHNLLY